MMRASDWKRELRLEQLLLRIGQAEIGEDIAALA